MRHALTAFLVALCSSVLLAQNRPVDPLDLARRLYNEEQYDEAIKLANEARIMPAHAHAASVVLARAHLERYRHSLEVTDLDRALEVLPTVDATQLSDRQEVEFLIALGESMYLDDRSGLDDRFSAAAEQFEIALGRASVLTARDRDLLFDWWAAALDRQAQQGHETDRRPIYDRIVRRAEQELTRPDASLSASYWLAAGARGVDDLSRASGAAVAGWLRASALGLAGETLRADLDRLMIQVILPERAQQLAAGADPKLTLEYLQANWDELKKRWE